MNKQFYRIKTPHVVHETIDGETILMDLRTGNYYSIEWPGTFIWEYISEEGAAETLISELSKIEGKKINEIQEAIQSFLNKLVEEDLLSVSENGQHEKIDLPDEVKAELRKLVSEYKEPEFNKYSDMQDMLLLDPIHDVDEKGWPEPKKKDT